MPKRRRSRRGRKTGWGGYLVSFLLGSCLALGTYAYLTQKNPSPSDPISQSILLIDPMISGQLFEMGLSKKHILLQKPAMRKEGTEDETPSILKIQLPRSLSVASVEKNFRQNLSVLGKPVSLHSSHPQGSLRLEVKVGDITTHQLIFIPPQPTPLQSRLRPRVALVIDDLGRDNLISHELLQCGFPVTFSILPFEPHSKNLALEAYQKGQEIILHLPLEPHGYPEVNPGEGALLLEMDKKTLLHQLLRDIEAVPYIKGVSNHMGSQFMENGEKMKIILTELRNRGLFFLDSRTTPQTVGLETANAIGLEAAERTVFLDHDLNEKAIEQSLERLLRLSLSKGKAIGIGHPHPLTIQAIKKMIPKMQEKGVEIVPLSAFMR
jgi:hypothetical protein